MTFFMYYDFNIVLLLQIYSVNILTLLSDLFFSCTATLFSYYNNFVIEHYYYYAFVLIINICFSLTLL